jgi:hypothetical protein
MGWRNRDLAQWKFRAVLGSRVVETFREVVAMLDARWQCLPVAAVQRGSQVAAAGSDREETAMISAR